MPNKRYWPHDETYAEWHRPASLARFMSVTEAESLSYIDIDFIDACPTCYETLLLVEAVRDRGQSDKVAIILQRLARRANVPAVVVFYTPSTSRRQPPPRDDLFDIDRFRVRPLWNPRHAAAPAGDQIYTPERWALLLLMLRRRHHDEEHVS